jgi:hypothetical protein
MAAKKKPARRRPKKAKAAKKTARRRRPKKAKAVKKAARSRRRRPKKAAKKASRRRSPKKAAKKASRRRSPKKAKGKKAKAKKAAPQRRRRRRVSAKAKARRALKSLSRSSSKAARALGMMKGARKNPAGILDFLKTEAKDMMAIAPSVAAQLGSMAAIGFASSKASEQIRKRAAVDGAMHKYAGAISSGAITLAAFAAMKMVKSDKVKQFTLPVLFGGMAATLVQVLAAVKVKPAKAEGVDPSTQQPISLGQKLGLPIGDYMALSGFVDVHGRPVAVNGMGDYVPQALGRIELSMGPYSEGTVVSMGDYVPQALGELSLHEGRFHEGTVIGEIGQMSEGRQGARALNSPGDPTFESFVDSGSLSGSVFD